MASIYLTKQGTCLKKSNGHFQIFFGEKKEKEIPLRQVDRVILMGNVQISPQATQFLLTENIDTYFLSLSGKYRGRLQPFTGYSSHRALKTQISRSEDPVFSLDAAKSFVFGKITNQMKFIRRLIGASGKSVKLLQNFARSSKDAADLASLRGFEGISSRVYFECLGKFVTNGFTFSDRNYHPPRDPFNSLLSLGYSLLAGNIISALEINRLRPDIGFLHSDKAGVPALALDLMEEFRSLIVDRLALSIIHKGVIQPEDFRWENGIPLLNKSALKKFFSTYNRKLMEEISHPSYKKPVTRFQIFEKQAGSLRSYILGRSDGYIPYMPD